MNDYITVKLNKADALSLLSDRLDAWSVCDDANVKELFVDMYDNMLESGCFDGIEWNVNSIVDNDVVNYCSVLYKADVKASDWKKLVNAWQENAGDIYDCKLDAGRWDRIEAMNETEGVCLVR